MEVYFRRGKGHILFNSLLQQDSKEEQTGRRLLFFLALIAPLQDARLNLSRLVKV